MTGLSYLKVQFHEKIEDSKIFKVCIDLFDYPTDFQFLLKTF